MNDATTQPEEHTIAVLMTCHNRREKTLECLRRIRDQRGVHAAIRTFLVDDGSSDGTGRAVVSEFPEVEVLQGDGSLYWCGGMRMAWEAATKSDPDFYLLLNDDTFLQPDALTELLGLAQGLESQSIVVGAICDPETGLVSYGGVRYASPLVPASGRPEYCDTFNANCALVPRKVFQVLGVFHKDFIHGLGDFDYGIQAIQKGFKVVQTPRYVGTCRDNPLSGTWSDRSLPRIRRLRLLNSPKGLPFRAWMTYVRRNTGWKWPLYLLSPYLKIVLGR